MMGDIIAKIWELPWYQVFVIAAVDDVILFLKLWWVLVIIVFLALIVGVFGE